MSPDAAMAAMVAAVSVGGGLLAATLSLWCDRRIDVLLDYRLLAAMRHRGGLAPGWRRLSVAQTLCILAVAGGQGPEPCRIVASAVLTGGLLVCAWLDIRHRALPDLVLAPLAALGLAVAGSPAGDPASMILGATAGGGVAAVVQGLARLRHGRLGGGDVKVMACLGVWLGPVGVLVAFWLAMLLLLAGMGRFGGRGGRQSWCVAPAVTAATMIIEIIQSCVHIAVI
jgi:prepilin signal peptidase PulO-like enzyme (type II secretory pathway)